MSETLVLDTNAFNEKGLPHFLHGYDGRSILPAVAAAELFVHMRQQRRWDRAKFQEHLRYMRVTVEPLDLRRVMVAVETAESSSETLSFDALIAAHALLPGRLLVTNNAVDFPQVSLQVSTAELLAR